MCRHCMITAYCQVLVICICICVCILINDSIFFFTASDDLGLCSDTSVGSICQLSKQVDTQVSSQSVPHSPSLSCLYLCLLPVCICICSCLFYLYLFFRESNVQTSLHSSLSQPFLCSYISDF